MYRQSTHSSLDSSAKAASQWQMAADLSQSQSKASLPAALPLSLPLAHISKLRDRLSFKQHRAALAEKEILKRENRAARPLTQRNVDTFLIEQDLNDARVRRAENLHVSQWLQQLP